MQSVMYQYEDMDEEKINNDTKLEAEHEAYVRNQSSKNGGKLDIDLYDCSKNFSKIIGLPSTTFDYYFDNAIEEELEEFARNDPWVKAGALKKWTTYLEINTFSLCQSMSSSGDMTSLSFLKRNHSSSDFSFLFDWN